MGRRLLAASGSVKQVLFQRRHLEWMSSESIAVLAAALSEPIPRTTILFGRNIRIGFLRNWSNAAV
jgi:hypothetical protein